MRYAIWNEFLAVDVEAILEPRGTEEVSSIVRRALAEGKHLKAIGGGHSFNDLSLSEDLLVDLRRMSGILEIDHGARTARVLGGTPLHVLVAALEREGLALANLGAWTEQTLAGVISTATHGSSGRYRKTLIGSVLSLTLIDGRGEARVLTGEALKVLTLGFFGIITEVVIRCEPLFYVRQSNRLRPGAEAIEGVEEELAAHDFVDLRWAGGGESIITRRWDIVEAPPGRADRLAHLVEGVKLHAFNALLAGLRTDALPRPLNRALYAGLAGAYVKQGEGLPHAAVYHRGLTFNSLGVAAPHEEREFGLPRAMARDCLRAARELMLADPTSACLEIQVRFTPKVDVLMAANGDRDTIWFNINVLSPAASAPLVDRLSRLMIDLGARPHWGKIIPARIPRLHVLYGDAPLRWEALRKSFDPEGLFLNDYYHRYFGYAGRSFPEQEEPELEGGAQG